MAEVDYPGSLPWPTRQGYGINHVSPMLVSTLESGRKRRRRRFTSVPSRVTVEWIMNEWQAQLFELWFRADFNESEPNRGGIQDGTVWFNCPLKTPIGERHYEAVFDDIYSGPEPYGLCQWRFTATLELRERPALPPGDIEFPDEIIYSSLFDYTMNKHWPEYDL